MDYMNDSFTYTAQHTHNQPVLYQPTTYFTFRPHQPQAVDDFYSYCQNEHTDFMQYHEDYEELGAVSTRPRLTREQVEVLEAQFQANHKPNSILKRHLAVQTRLSPARVAVSSYQPSASDLH
jgi:Homeodomain